jgi:hypothetical protein
MRSPVRIGFSALKKFNHPALLLGLRVERTVAA